MRVAFVEQMQACDPERLIFIDESGSHVAMTRTHGWGPIGQRVHGVVPRNRGRVTTMLGALSIDGVEAMMTVEGGTTAAVFLKFIDEHLARPPFAHDAVQAPQGGRVRVTSRRPGAAVPRTPT